MPGSRTLKVNYAMPLTNSLNFSLLYNNEALQNIVSTLRVFKSNQKFFCFVYYESRAKQPISSYNEVC